MMATRIMRQNFKKICNYRLIFANKIVEVKRGLAHPIIFNQVCFRFSSNNINNEITLPENDEISAQREESFREKLNNWNKKSVEELEDHQNEIKEFMKLSAKILRSSIKIEDLLAIMKLYSSFKFGDTIFYKKLINITTHKLGSMNPSEVVTSFMCISLISQMSGIEVDTEKIMNMASYKILKSLYSLNASQISNVLYCLGKTQYANKRILKSYKEVINNKFYEFNADCCHKILIGYILSGQFTSQDSEFLEKILSKISYDISNGNNLRSDQLTKLFYNCYGKNLASISFTYHQEVEEAIYERAHQLDFSQIAQVLSTFKFMERKITDERLEKAIENYIEKLVPKEISYLLRYFYNDKVDIGLSKRIQDRLEEIIKAEIKEMNAEELSITYSSLALAKKSSPKLLEYLEENLSTKEKEFTLESILNLMNLKLQGNAEFFDVK